MMGNVTDKGEQQLHGIIPRAIAHIFQTIPRLPNATTAAATSSDTAPTDAVSYAVGMSYFEIYNEKVYDLLASSVDATRSPLDVRETPDHQTYVDSLTTRIIASPDDALRWIERGNDNRRVAATAHNVVSSRSHGVIQVTVERKTAGGVTASRLSLVDLAGSEKYDSATHGSSSRDGKSKREEMSAINKSLNTLALVVNALTQQQQQRSSSTAARTAATHIPYRNSTLTHLLKDSLGGHSKAAIIACINPTVDAAYESTNTLKWASNAKHVRNIVKREEERNNSGDSTALIQSLHAEIERLKRSERVEKCKRYRVYDLLPDFAMKVLEDTGQPDEEGAAKVAAGGVNERKEQPSARLQLGEEKVVGLNSESDESAMSISRRSSVDLSVRLHDTLLESTITLDSTLDSSTGCPTNPASRRAQVAGVFSSPSRLRWKVVRETFSSHNATKPLDETAGSEAALFSPASQRRLEAAEEEYEQRRASWQREKERMRHARNEKRRESVWESEKSIREAQQRYEAKCKELDDTKAAYEEERCAKEEERQRLLHQLDTVEEHNADRDEEVGRLLSELAACEARLEAMQEQHIAEAQSQSVALADGAASIASLQYRLQEVETEHLSLQQRIVHLQTELHAANGVKERLQTKITMLTLDLVSRDEQQQSTAALHNQQLEQLEGEVKRQQEELEESRQQLTGKQVEHAANQQHLKHIAEGLQHQLDEAEERHTAVQAEGAERRAQYEADLVAAQHRLDEQLHTSEQAKQATVDKHAKDEAEQTKRIATLQAQLASVKQQLSVLQAALNTTMSEHRADRIRLLQQFDAQLHAQQQAHRADQLKSEAGLQRRRKVENAVIEQIHSRHQQQLSAVEERVAAAKAEEAQQQQLQQAETEVRSQQHDMQLAAMQQQYQAELIRLGDAGEQRVEALRADLQAQVTSFEVELAAAKAESVQQRAYQEADMAFLQQRIATAAAAARAEFDEAVAVLKMAHEQANGELQQHLSEQSAVCDRLQCHVQLVEATLAELRAEAETAQQQLGDSQRQFVQLQATLAAADMRHQREIERKNVQLLTTTYIACATQTALKRRIIAYDAAAAVIALLREEKQQLCDEMSALQVDMSAMQATHELQLDAKDEQLASRSNTIARLQGSGEESETDRVALHQRIDQLHNALIESEAHRQHLLTRIEALQAAIRQQDELLAIVQADAANQRVAAEESHERQVTELDNQVTALGQQQAAALAMHERVTSELNQRLAATQRDVESKDVSLASINATLSAERMACRDETFAHHVRVASLEQQLDITESARSDAADHVHQLTADSQQLQHRLRDNQQRVKELEAQLVEAVARRDAAEAEQREVKAQCVARVRAVELKSQAAMSEERSERYTELAATMAGYDAQVARLERQLADNQNVLNTANTQNTQLHDHIAALVERQEHCTCDAGHPAASEDETPGSDEEEAVRPTPRQPPVSHGGVATRVIGVLRFVTFGFVTDSLGFCTR